MSAILKRKVFFIQIRLKSPLNVSSGEAEWTDADILKDDSGSPFVPGSSLAGAMRAYLEKEKNQSCFMGYAADGSEGKMSSLFLSDLILDTGIEWGIRDGVKLDENKAAVSGSKYDMEILEAGAEGHFFAELVIRENDNEHQMDQELAEICHGIQQGEIRLGSKKTRGFGKFEIISFAEQTYGKSNYLEYARAYDVALWKEQPDKLKSWMEDVSGERKMVHIKVPLKLKGGISIRQYAAKKDEQDFVQLTVHEKAVIPGSSFAGAIRHRTKKILCEMRENGVILPISVDDIIKRMFGYVEGKEACASNVIISESEVKGARTVTMVRTGISRFESAVKERSLYKEKTYVDGIVDLEIAVRKEHNPLDTRWILGILLLALKDLQNGYLAVGGQTAIGRGVFEQNGAIVIEGIEGTEEEFIAEAFQSLSEGEGEKL